MIDRSSHIPYYLQLKDEILKRVERGEWKAGDRLPSEAELCERYRVSRTVVRQALAELEHQDRIRREKGKGTFISEPKINENLVQRLTGFHQDMTEHGFKTESQVLKLDVIQATDRVSKYLQLDPGAPVIELSRLRLVNGEPIVLVTTFLPHVRCAAILRADLTNESLYGLLEKECGIVIARGHRTIEAVRASAQEAGLLGIERGVPLLLLESISYLEDGSPIEFYHALHRSDRSRFEVELVRVREPAVFTQNLTAGAQLPPSNLVHF